jgi:hypothetical protein
MVVIAAAIVITFLIVFADDLWPEGPINGIDHEVLLDYYWEAYGSQNNPDILETNQTFVIEKGTSTLKLSYNLDLPLSTVSDQDPEVHLRLFDAGNNLLWEGSYYESTIDSRTFSDPVPGTWSLRIEATGYSMETPGLELNDSLRVTVEVW